VISDPSAQPLPPIRGAFRTDSRARAAYAEAAGIYRIVPSGVALPVDLTDLAVLVQWAALTATPLIPRGAGSAMGGGNVGEGVVVDLTALAPTPLTIHPERRVAVAGATVTLDALNTAALVHGLRLPPDPSSSRWATLGGMLSTNAAGARSVRDGSVRPWVEALTYLNGDGQLITLERGNAAPDALAALMTRLQQHANAITSHFPKTRKNSAGYALDSALESGDVLDLLIGAEGTLGIVTEITWRLDAIPSQRASLRVTLTSLDTLGDIVELLLVHQPSALELLDQSFLELVAERLAPNVAAAVEGAPAVLLVELERGDAPEMAHLLTRIAAELTHRVRDVTVATSSEAQAELWALRHAASPILAGLTDDRRSLQVIEDGCVPIRHLAEYIRNVRDSAARHGVDAVLFGHAGDGHVHVNLLPHMSEPDWPARVRAIYNDVTAACLALGGTPAGEHGDGRLRAPLLPRIYGGEVMALFADVKRTFDPAGIFNPGIILGHPDADPISQLKAGAGAASLPDDIAEALRTIERTGGYATSRIGLA
jgi:FAD/FMN-containing dehydrogenase